MHTLRARLLAVVLSLSALGLIALAAVTYAEQRSFLQARVNEEVKRAGPAIDDALQTSQHPNSGGEREAAKQGNQGRGGPPPGPSSLPPAGTYGESRSESGEVLEEIPFNYGQSAEPKPKLPKNVPLEKLFTVGSYGSSGLDYRVYAINDSDDGEIVIAAVPLSEIDGTLENLLIVEGLVIAGVLLAIGLAAYFVVRLGLRPLDRIERTAGEIAGGRLSRRVSPATSRTEVGRLGIALNQMLDRLEQAFKQREASEERLRRFLADASHELRTPLASIRGYAELYRMGATQDEEGTRTAMQRIESESRRMGTLVEDMLTLARLDEERVPQRAPLDLVALAHDVVTDARATAPDRKIELGGHESASLRGDAHQLHQVLANMMRNALVHTPPGTPIEVQIADARASIVARVRDHGPGLPAAARESLFDRFWRAEGGRERGKAGAGLGLAIVREIVVAHGGEIEADNAPDGGAIFTVRLPKAPRRAAKDAPGATKDAPRAMKDAPGATKDALGAAKDAPSATKDASTIETSPAQ
ncbi:MAG: sensor histidine kinase [Solirubrobacteraceae bacterium]